MSLKVHMEQITQILSAAGYSMDHLSPFCHMTHEDSLACQFSFHYEVWINVLGELFM
jgi:hypothetical protein